MINIHIIKENYKTALIKSCKEENCKLFLDKLQNVAILKGESILNNKKMCDCIIFISQDNNKPIIGIVELKSKTVHSSEILEKFNNCAEVVSTILDNMSINPSKINFYPILLSKRYDTSEVKQLKRIKIFFYGKPYGLIWKRCGHKFIDIISSLENF